VGRHPESGYTWGLFEHSRIYRLHARELEEVSVPLVIGCWLYGRCAGMILGSSNVDLFLADSGGVLAGGL
jgi:hypothetical protein